jgi:hypothetical protein
MQRTHYAISGSILMVALSSCGEKASPFSDGAGASAMTGGAAGSGGANASGAAGVSAAGNGGSAAGGSAGSGAAAGAGNPGGAAGSGAGSGGNSGGAGGGIPVSCTITATSSVSSVIPTVGIVTFSTDLAGITDARVEFGLTTAYGISAPVNLAQPSYRTLLLGMKASREYHFRVVARAGQSECTSMDHTVMTGALMNVPTVTRTTNDEAALAGGYLVGTLSQASAAFILDADGDFVWWFTSGGGSRAQMSYDGQFMWFLSTNQGGGNPNVRRIGMDGMGLEMHPEFGDAHHDIVVLPDESVGFFQYYMNGRDRLMERASDGTLRQVVDVPMAHGGVTNNHANSIQYYAPDDSYTFSDLDQNCYVKVSRQGQVAWVLGGDTSDFTGAGATWTREHGHQLIAPNRLLFFNNGTQGSSAVVREVTLDFDTMTATGTWQYDGDETSQTLGDAQRLWNGNTLATYSNSNTTHEVSPSGELLQSMSFSASGLGYTMKRRSLYGPPPKQTGP